MIKINPYLFAGLENKTKILLKINKNDKRIVFLKESKKIFDKYFGFDIQLGKGDRKKTFARKMFLYMMLTTCPSKTGRKIEWEKLSGFLGQRHSTVRDAQIDIQNWYQTDFNVKQTYNELLNEVKKIKL